jgi:hypothetical protein
LTLHDIGQASHLLFASMIEELLDDIVTKDIGHERERIRQDLAVHGLSVLFRCIFEFGLDEAGAMLVTGKLDDMSKDLLPGH